jgi:fermentation-respiration switch protein FrsA (DUF1100 family)
MSMLFLAAAAALASSNVTTAGPKGPLAATLIDPGKQAPALILIPGSGPTDRDGNNVMGVSGGIYRRLAEQLAARGVATLRIDKRGMFGSKAAIADANAVTIADYAADVHGWATFMRARDKIACGSRGIARAASSRSPPRSGRKGFAASSCSPRPDGRLEISFAQLKPKLPPEMFASAEAAITRLEQRQRVDPASVPAPLAPLFNTAVQGYMIDLMAQDPVKLAAATRLPMLIVQGETDIHVGVDDARALAAAHPGAKLVLIPGINHLWRKAPADPAANAATYRDASIPVDPAVATAIARFVSTKR